MTTGHPAFARLVFAFDFDELAAFEIEAKGWCGAVQVELDDGTRHPACFYDVVRLSQTLDDDCASGRSFLAEPGLIIVPSVTLAHMEAAARTLAGEGFFARSGDLPVTGRSISVINRGPDELPVGIEPEGDCIPLQPRETLEIRYLDDGDPDLAIECDGNLLSVYLNGEKEAWKGDERLR
jgi:hypothetical protein